MPAQPKTILHVGLIGFGLSGRYFHAPFLAVNPHFKLTKVVTRNKSAVHEFDANIEVVGSADELLADASIDLVFILAIVIALLTVSYQAIIAALMNPVESLKTE